MSGYNSPTVQQCRGCYSKIQAVEGIVHSITSLCMSAAKNGYASIVCAKFKMDKEMLSALNRMFEEHQYMCFSKLADRSIISTLNSTQSRFAEDGYRFYDFISEGILHTKDINRKINSDWLFTMTINKKTEYFYAREKFREMVLDRYGE